MSQNLKKYEKNCPNCGKVQTYKSETYLKRAVKKNSWCIYCANKKRSVGENNGMYGKKHNPETIQKIKEKRKLQIITEETRKKMRKIASQRMVENNWHPSYNETACHIINEYGEKNGYNFRTALDDEGEFFIEELGYWVDGYDEEKNVVIEYYEEFHQYQKERDLERQKEIEDYLGCEFIVIKECI